MGWQAGGRNRSARFAGGGVESSSGGIGGKGLSGRGL